MNLRSMFGKLIFLLVLAVQVKSQYCHGQQVASGWEKVKALPPGSHIVVITVHTLPCTLISASDEGVTCEQYRPIDKSRINEIKSGKSSTGTIAGVALGAAAGGGLGAGAGGNHATNAIVGAGLGAAVGGFIGHVIGSRHGNVIYQR